MTKKKTNNHNNETNEEKNDMATNNGNETNNNETNKEKNNMATNNGNETNNGKEEKNDMATNNDDENTRGYELDELVEAGDAAEAEKMMLEAQRVELNGEEYGLPRLTLNILLTVGEQLMSDCPPRQTKEEKATFGEMVEAIRVGRAHVANQQAATELNGRVVRNRTLVRLARVMATFDTYEGSDKEGEARAVRAAVFGHLGDLSKTTQRGVWEGLTQVKVKLDDDPALAARTEALVGDGGRMRLLFEARTELGATFGLGGGHNPVALLDPELVIAFVRRRVTAYVIQVLATARGSLGRAQRAAGALKGVYNVRQEVKERRARRKLKRLADDVEDEDDLEDLDVEAPAPAVTAPVGAAGGDG